MLPRRFGRAVEEYGIDVAMAKSVEKRFPTKRARDAADRAIDNLSETEPMTTYLDTWLRVYRENGGIEKK